MERGIVTSYSQEEGGVDGTILLGSLCTSLYIPTSYSLFKCCHFYLSVLITNTIRLDQFKEVLEDLGFNLMSIET
ncbi:MAG: hypothetical protein HXS44_17765 [Theionarchaea archaeon]|nr:hypothetical protein [Theionarchaea archaeon]